MERQPPRIERFSVVEMPVLFEVICRVSAIPIKNNPLHFLIGPVQYSSFQTLSISSLKIRLGLYVRMCLLNCLNLHNVVVVQSLSHVRLLETSLTAAHQASLPFITSWNLLKLMSTESVIPSHPLSHPSPPALNPSQHQTVETVADFISLGSKINADGDCSREIKKKKKTKKKLTPWKESYDQPR